MIPVPPPVGYWTCRACTEVIADTGDGFATRACPTCGGMNWAWLPQPEIVATFPAPIFQGMLVVIGRLLKRQQRVRR